MSTLPALTSGWRSWFAPLIRAWRRHWHPPMVQQVSAQDVIELRHQILRKGRPRDSAIWDGDLDPETRHWAVLWGGEIVAVATVLARSEATHLTYRWQLRGMATASHARGKGLGGSLLQQIMKDVGEPMWCNARVTARAFYLRNKWQHDGPPFDIPRIGLHYRMFSPQ